jgi:hypothetical protein
MNIPLLKSHLQNVACEVRAIVAIPAKDEAAKLPACLQALNRQADARGGALQPGTFGVIVYANNCSDGSADVARRMSAIASFPLRVVEASLPPGDAHAGGARRRAMDLAAAWLREGDAPDGVILTTDADSEVSPHWIGANLTAIDKGADAVLGRISLDADGERLPAALHVRGRMEGVYEELLAEISARLDPLAWNPWPHHSTISGASVSVTRKMYERVGGLPDIALGEEKAFAARLRRHGARVRFAPDVSVVTSARLAGRAVGGVADTLRIRSEDPAALCDESLEPCATAFKRARWRGRLRRDGLRLEIRWREALALSCAAGENAVTAATFGESWHLIEEASPALAHVKLAPSELPAQIRRARRLLSRLKGVLPPLQNVEAIFRTAPGANDINVDRKLIDEEFGGLVAAQGVVGHTCPMDEHDCALRRQRIEDTAGEYGEIGSVEIV